MGFIDGASCLPDVLKDLMLSATGPSLDLIIHHSPPTLHGRLDALFFSNIPLREARRVRAVPLVLRRGADAELVRRTAPLANGQLRRNLHFYFPGPTLTRDQ
jgi:hypothetical protein